MKYIDGLTRIACVKIAKWQRQQFSQLIQHGKIKIPEGKFCPPNLVIPSFVSFSCSRDIEEQILSILTLIYWVGKPQSWTIYSDGTYSNEQVQLLQSLGDFIKVKLWDENKTSSTLVGYESYMTDYASNHALGKRFCAYTTHKVDVPTIFLDSDVLFYQQAPIFLEVALREGGHWFLPDIGWGTLDSRYTEHHGREMFQLNGGFFITCPGFSWEPALDFLRFANNKFEYFTEQTATHIAFQKQSGKPLNSLYFVLSTSDQFQFNLHYQTSEIAIRHYVNPVRHKMWQFGWQWHIT